MQINMYAAAVFTNNMQPGQTNYERKLTDIEKRCASGIPHILESYHYINKDKVARQIRATGRKIFLDSGAFSMWTQGIEIDVATYARFIKEYEDIFLVDEGVPMIAGLDVIGSGDAADTYENVRKLWAEHGIKSIPTFHAGEDERWLDYYANNFEYIALGGVAQVATSQMIIWMDRVWERYLTDGAGRPKCKVHGFATTSIPLMERYPWRSVDSSTWVQIASYGGIWVPELNNIVLKVSSGSPEKHEHGKHITTLTEIERQYVEQMLTGHGFDLQRLADVPFSRFAYNLWAYDVINTRVNEKINQHGYPRRQIQLF